MEGFQYDIPELCYVAGHVYPDYFVVGRNLICNCTTERALSLPGQLQI
jgi:hypothetical protein